MNPRCMNGTFWDTYLLGAVAKTEKKLDGSSSLEVLFDFLGELGVAAVDFLVEFSVALVDVRDVLVLVVHTPPVEIFTLNF